MYIGKTGRHKKNNGANVFNKINTKPKFKIIQDINYNKIKKIL